MNFRDEKAIYLQIEEFVCEQILSGRWPVGEKLCSVRELASSLEVNPNTVMRAYTELSDEKIIENKRGIGFFIAADAAATIRESNRQEFLHQELPLLLKKAKLLQISSEEITAIYQSL